MIVVVCGTFARKCELVKEIEKSECGAGFDGFLRGRIETMAKKLNVKWNGASAATILDGDLMNSVGVDHK